MLEFVDMPINPPGPHRFTVVSTFAGCGGSSLGYKWAGGKVLAAIEWDQNAVDTYRLNHEGTPVLHRDIATVTVEELLALTGLKAGELDVLDGSPPCQGFSTAGKRNIDDPRNQLFREYVRLLEGLKPRVFVMENVSGMVKGKMRLVFRDILQALKGCGYRVSARLLNAMYFGVPQSRQRLIFIGVREDLGIEPNHPKAQTRPIPFRDACYDLRGNREDDRLVGEVIKAYTKVHPGGYNTDDRLLKHIKGTSGGGRNLKWLTWDRVCGTIVKHEVSITGLVHPDRERYISLREMKRVSTFPDEFQFTDRNKGVERIGNTVPPMFMKAIAEHIRDTVLEAT